MTNISLTVPMDKNALTRAAEMLQGLASDLGAEPVAPAAAPAPAPVAVEETTVTEPAATEVFAQQQPAAPSPSLFAEQPAEAPKPEAAESATTATATDSVQPAETTANAATTAETPAPAPNATAAAGVDLAPATTNPEVSIPWDARIHAGSKAKLAKKPNGWKMKRGVDSDLVDTVEAELMAAMAASPANPVEPAPAQEPAPAASPAPAPAPAQPAAPAGAITTFPELMAKITASGIDQATVTAAVNKQGLQALPLLAARPDLIPAVAAELFPGG